MKILIVCLLVTVLSACAGVNIFNSESQKGAKPSGVRFYSPKPYLLVARTNKKDEPISVDVVFLPDLANPQFASQKRGIGSYQLTLKLNNGIITEFGNSGDSKVPETISALTGGLKTIAEAVKIQRERELLEPQGLGTEKLQELSQQLRSVSSDIDGYVSEYKRITSTVNGDKLKTVADNLVLEANQLDAPDVAAKVSQRIANLQKLSEALQGLIIQGETNAAAKAANAKITEWRSAIDEVIKELTPKQEPQPTIELYEFVITDGRTTLHRVDIPSQ